MINQLKSINSIEELVEFMNTYIKYGWVDIYNNIHYCELKNIRTNYRINTEKMVEENLAGLCFEQCIMIDEWLKAHNYNHEIYCLRKSSVNKDEEIPFYHVFILFEYKNKIAHIENILMGQKGIKYFNNKIEAIKYILNQFNPTFFDEIIQLENIPENYNLSELDTYFSTNKFDNVRTKI